ncbi:ABC transporter ATP-binding protein [filamentous cyanobacterium CCP5]|nr:ABC transporter ATP-binding protein [filamentous cyanobacterium CCP5]
MSDTVIQVENLGKKYIIGHQQEGHHRYKALRDVIADGARSLGTKIRNPRKAMAPKNQEEFWALKDVSFEVKRGEVVGIIGRNGAGKSTLLKVLSRITEPTTGRVKLKGRVASLLEVGTGFHPELTGRENIFLNGAILGMSKVEINRKFDEIVEFAEVSRFLDTPVKRYSSGMYVRLAFAVAAHLEPEILVVDEVLAVGDAAFQKKCLGKMGDVAQQEGKTILFVSHNMASVERLCQKGIYLSRGSVDFIGKQSNAIAKYLKSSSNESNLLDQSLNRKGSGEIRITSFEIRDLKGNHLDNICSGDSIDIILNYEAAPQALPVEPIISIAVRTQLELPVFLQHNRLMGKEIKVSSTKGCIVCRIKNLPLPADNYLVTYSIISNGSYIDAIENAFQLPVIGGDFFGSGEIPPISHGVCLVSADWRLES